MKARWLIMLLGANAGGWTTVVSMAGHVEPRALNFYKKAVRGTLRTITPHTEQFKQSVTSTGIQGFEGIVEGELLSPCDLKPADEIAFINNQFALGDNATWKHWKADWATECERRLHKDKGSGKERSDGALDDANPWIGVLLGIVADASKYLCHQEDCKGGTNTYALNFQQTNFDGNGWEKTWNSGFRSASELKKNYKLSHNFFKSVFYELQDRSRGNWKCSELNEKEEQNCGKIGEIRKFQERIGEKCGADEDSEGCKGWINSLSGKKYIYVIDKASAGAGRIFNSDNWWVNDGRKRWNEAWKNQTAFWWWFGASPDANGTLEGDDSRDASYQSLKKTWTEVIPEKENCVPRPRILNEGWTGKKLELTIETIRCE